MNLTAEQERLYGKLDRLWNWLRDNPKHPEHDRRFLVWESALHKYEQVSDQIDSSITQLPLAGDEG
jgi:hypothetical protein